MQHRHLNHQEFTLAAVDDIIRRGGWRVWVLLRRAAHRDAAVLARIQRIAALLTATRRRKAPNDSAFGGSMPGDSLPPWDDVLSAAARLQSLLPDAVLVGGTAGMPCSNSFFAYSARVSAL